MTLFLMSLAGVLLAMSLTVVIFSTTSNDKNVRAYAGGGIRWSMVWMMLFMSFFYMHSLQEELETYKTQEQIHVEN